MSERFEIEDAIAKAHSVLSKYDIDKVKVAYSGGSDSDTVLWFLKNIGYDVGAVFYDTGLEYKATHEHIENMRNYFEIDVIKAKMSIPTSNKKYGHPFISKLVSDYLSRLQKHNFDFSEDGNKSFEDLWKKYPNAKSALQWWTNKNKTYFRIDRNKYLKEFLIEYGLPFRVSSKCCEGAKKQPAKQYFIDNGIELCIMGIRQNEQRAGYSNCFIPAKKWPYDIYFPLYWWSDKTKNKYDYDNKIIHSKCYTEYGLSRTGCAGCPYGRNFEQELLVLEKHEPKLHNGVKNIFSESYEWTRVYREFKKKNGDNRQIDLFIAQSQDNQDG